MNTRELLLSTHAKLQGLRTARSAYASQLAPDFNVIGLLSPGEVKLSSLLRELLDPCGSHAQGRKFLDLFISQHGLTAFANHDVLSVDTEVRTDSIEKSERRIDILIEFVSSVSGRKLALAIENKPWHFDGDRQISDYLSHLAQKYLDGYALIYLPGHEARVPEENSITEIEAAKAISEEHLFISSYAGLRPWLAACRSQCEAPSVRAFLQSFEQYILQKFMGVTDMIERQQLISDATCSPEAVEISLELSLAQADIKKALINKLEIQLREGIDKGGRGWILLGGVDISNNYGGCSIQLEKGDQYTVSFECEFKGGGDFYYGICKNYETDEDLPDVTKALDLEFAKGRASSWWPWIQPFAPSLADWRYSTEPWVQIASGAMSEWMLATVLKIEQELKNKELKHCLKGDGKRLK